jgi:hypothetical protein
MAFFMGKSEPEGKRLTAGFPALTRVGGCAKVADGFVQFSALY